MLSAVTDDIETVIEYASEKFHAKFCKQVYFKLRSTNGQFLSAVTVLEWPMWNIRSADDSCRVADLIELRCNSTGTADMDVTVMEELTRT